jgi:hypothetical protein
MAAHASMRQLTTISLPILTGEKIGIRFINQILRDQRDLPITMMITSLPPPPQNLPHPRNAIPIMMTITNQVQNPHQAHTTTTITTATATITATTIQNTNLVEDLPLLPLIQMITSQARNLPLIMIIIAALTIQIVLRINQRIVSALQIIMALQRVTADLQKARIEPHVSTRAEATEVIKIEKRIDIQADIK